MSVWPRRARETRECVRAAVEAQVPQAEYAEVGARVARGKRARCRKRSRVDDALESTKAALDAIGGGVLSGRCS